MICLRMLIGGCLSSLVIMISPLKTIYPYSIILLDSHATQYQHEDVIMRLFSSSLIGDARSWYNNLPDKGIKTWQALQDAFIKRWEIKKDGRLLLTQFSQIKKKK
jgi:hypothetical protein